MKLLQRLFVGLAILVVALVALGLFLPTHSHVERSTTTAASADSVYAVVSNLRRFNEWSPWARLDPATRYTYGGPAAGVGARMAWTSERKEVGRGNQEIVAVEPGRSVTIRLDFGEESPSLMQLTLQPEGQGTRIAWSMDGDFRDNYLGRYFAPLLDRMVGPDLEDGLARLKRLVEAAPRADAPLTSSESPAAQ